METVLAVLAVVGAVAAIKRHWQTTEEEPAKYDAAELSDAIHALAELAEQLDNVDRMLADLQACNPRELLRSFRAQWCGLDGKQRSIDLWADGANSTTAGLIAAAEEQREEINAEICETVRAMAAALDAGCAPALRMNAVDETVDETTGFDSAGEW